MLNLAKSVEQLSPLKRALVALVRMQAKLEQVKQFRTGLHGRDQLSEGEDFSSTFPATEASAEERQQAFKEWNALDLAEIAGLSEGEIEAQLIAKLRMLEKRWHESDLSAHVEQLSPLKRTLLALEKMQEKLEQIEASQLNPPPLQPIARDGELPLSFAQQRLWFLDQLDPGKAVYNEYSALQLKGMLHKEVLERSINEILRRHESLRTHFPSVNGRTVQQIFPWQPMKLGVVNLQNLSVSLREARAMEMAEAEVKQPFDLSSGPLFKIRLFQLNEDDHLLLVIFHHIIGDGWSMGVFYRELNLLYEAYCHNNISPLVELPIQYADFAAWQQQWLRGEVLEEQMGYWVNQFEGATTVLELPTDHPRPAMPTNEGAHLSFTLSPLLTKALKELSQREEVTLFMTLLAAFQVLLNRYTGQEDILIGTSIANRTSAELETLIGFFANTLVLRGEMSGNPSFRELLGRIRAVALGAYAHQDIPFEQLVSTLKIERDLSRSPLFQVMFVLQKASWLDTRLLGLTVNSVEIERKRATFDLVLSMTENEESLQGTLEYSTDLFDGATMVRLAGHFQTLLGSIVIHPEQHINELPLLNEIEREQMLVTWNDTGSVNHDYASIHQFFEEQVIRMPDAVAVAYKNEQLTYDELNRRANQLAHYLRSLGVGPDVLVGICVERSLEMIVGILGVLKAGGAYIPLDPSYPAERLVFILANAAAPVLLTQQRLERNINSSTSKVVCLDADWAIIGQQSEANATCVVDSHNLAYVIYTSGSTGKPKGVLVEHASLCNLVEAQIRDFEVGTDSRVLQFVSFNFDVSVADIFMSLCAGATLYLVPLEAMVPGPALLDLLRKHAITIARIPSSVLATLPSEGLPSLQTLICGGESWSSDIITRWGAGRRFFNEYGPTETTICATMAECFCDDQSPTIGRPLANVRVYVVDSELTPVPVGAAGELCIGGIGLARGYLQRPETTAEQFVPDPFSFEEGNRLYKTGDLVRYLPDGTIKFLGRIDQQVKVRGFRIELGEIETALSQHPHLRECIVTVREDKPGDKRLVAYIVLEEQKEHPISVTSSLRDFLKEQLPEYMVPSAFVQLDALPLSSNGKVDRRALPALETTRPELTEEYKPPQTNIEQSIASVWREILQLEKVGLQDNFFELGGHSLSMVQVHRRLRDLVNADLTLVDLFKYPTIRALADFLNEEQKELLTDQETVRTEILHKSVKQVASYAPDTAIIGMAGRFPMARDVDDFWQNVQDGRETISFFSTEELMAAGVDSALLRDPKFVPAGAVLDNIEYFDAPFFGYSPREAEIIDPQQRLFLESAWQALEDAGYNAQSYSGSIAVYAGVSMNTYLAANLQGNPALADSVGNYQLVMGNSADFLTTRVSYKLNLRGPSVTVQTACSTSLVAVHMACESLRAGTCDMALAGGVSVRIPQRTGYLYQEGGIMSPDGHCRAFDERAQGIVGGEGAGVVVLKRLADALADGNTIHAVIKGSAMNNDGSLKVGYTAPSVQGQAQVITEALAMAEVAPETVSYIETHGTGTPLGDPIEVAALRQVYKTSSRKEFCALGSVKTNMGHLDAAAGVAGLLKTVQALKHQVLPPSLHFNTPNPALGLENSPFYVNAARAPWERNGTPRRAGVSSFGIGGTNAHVVLEEAPPLEPPTSNSVRPWQLVVLSAKTENALRQARANLGEHLQQHLEVDLADVAYTLQLGRQAFKYRQMVVCQDVADAVQVLNSPDNVESARLLRAATETSERSGVFLFPGQGAQYIRMGQELYQLEPLFCAEVDHCAEILTPYLGLDLRTILYPAQEDAEDAARQLNQTWLTQPALFVTEYALAKLWMAWGVQPAAMLGHSIGEYIAACLAGVFTLEVALKLVATRGRLMQQLPQGAMLAIPLTEQEVLPLLGEQLDLASVNTAAQCVVAGPTDAIESLSQRLLAQDINCQHLRTSHAFHSKVMEPILETFAAEIKTVRLESPQLRYISNVTGTWITTTQATDPHYWVRHLRQTVRFADGIRELLAHTEWALLEVGPGQVLSSFFRQQGQLDKEHFLSQVIVPSLRRATVEQSDIACILTSLGQLWLAGVAVKWSGLYTHERRQRISLPTYPFERQRYWVERLHNGHLARNGHNGNQQLADLVEITTHEGEVSQKEVSAGLHPRPNLPTAYVAPCNEIERKIADVWQQLLGIESVGIHDNFFDLGGHSLLATQISSRLQNLLQVDVPLRDVFETMTVAELAGRVEARYKETQNQQTLDIVRVPRERKLPLSFAQQRIWLLDQLMPGNPLYNIPIAARLLGPLDTAVLEKSLQEIVRRHESLRTTISIVDGQPVQVIHLTFNVPLFVKNIQEFSVHEREGEMLRIANEEALQPYNLAQGPLLRTTLLCLDEQEHVLLLTMHHTIADGWSMGVFFRELTVLYSAFCKGEPSPLPDLPIQYVDFAAWQRQWLQGEVLEKQLAYWKNQLGGNLPVLELSTDHTRPPIQTYRGAHQSAALPASLMESIKKLSQQEDVTLFMTVLAAFQVLLYRYTGQEDTLVGTPIASRNRTDIEDLIGNFIGALVLRTDLSGNPTFHELLSRVREVTLGAYAHQDMPFEQLVDALQPERDRSRSPLFQVLLRLPNASVAPFMFGDLTLKLMPIKTATANHDLTLDMVETVNGFIAEVEYNTDLFEAGTITRLLGHWQTILAAIAANPQQRIAELPWLTLVERRQLLESWNTSRTDSYIPLRVREVFEAQVTHTPQAIAVVFEHERVTYRELNQQANKLAHHLRDLGVGPDVLVGVCVERSIAMVVALLGILKAGGAYVPLDPAYPEDRLAFMMEDASLHLLLTHERIKDRLPTHIPCPKLCLDTDWPGIARKSEENLIVSEDALNLAYVIYTSGSTGRPKGVLVSHYGFYNLVEEQRKAFDIQSSDHILQFASMSFDASVSEIFTALSTGARLCLGTADALMPGPALMELMREQQISLVTLPPSALAVLPVEALKNVRTLVVAGEACATEIVQQWARGRRFLNAYGPTEGTVCATIEVCDANSIKRPTIGRPIGGAEVYLLDAALQPVPIGVPGELYLSGVGLARGYLHQAGLTAEKFIPHPFSLRQGERLYKTGDMARYRADGSIDFLGRVDQQVKVRGFRIELGEIEAVLYQHLAIRECVTIVREDVPDDKRLVAYIVPEQEQEIAVTVNELRSYLKERLPEYMIPNTFMLLDALPLTPNGKVDRRALPSPYLLEADADEDYMPPRSPVEELLAAAFAELLGVKQVGIYDNFFELGGHSLLATQLLSQLQLHLQIEAPLQVLFEAPTVAELAIHVEQILQSAQGLQVPPIVPLVHEGHAPLSFAQQRIWFLDQLQPDSAFYTIPCAFRLSGAIHAATLERSLQEIVQRHEILRTTFTTVDEQLVQIIDPAASLSLAIVNLSKLAKSESDAEVQRLTNEEAQLPFDLTQGPLLRATLLRLGVEEGILLLTLHNIVSDGWSREVFIRELVTIYEAFASGLPSPLPELPIQYADFAVWQREWLQGEVLDMQLSYWQKQLANAPTVLELPLDRPRPAIQTYRGSHLSISLPASLTEDLKKLSQQEGVTLFMTLLTSFQALLSRYTGQEDSVIGSPIANRNRPEIEGLIGFFANTLVLRTDLTGNPSFRELLGRVRTVALGAYAHQDMPFEKLVEALQPERNLSYSPLFQVMFTVQNIAAQNERVSWLSAENVGIETQTAKFDMNVFLVDRGQGLTGQIEYNTDLFDVSTINRLLRHWQALLEIVVANPDTQLTGLPPEYVQQQRLAISATFTAEPLEEALNFWMQELMLPLRIAFAAYQQVFQQLLDPNSLLSHNRRGMNVLLVRFEDWLRTEHGMQPLATFLPDHYEKIERNVQDLLRALRTAVQHVATPYLLCVCPPSPTAADNRDVLTFFERMEELLVAELQEISGVYVVSSAELMSTYPVATSYDSVGDELGHVPYTPAFFAALATMVARKLVAVLNAPYKVIAVDCDHTLWKGVCGEDGPLGIELDAPYLAFQQFLVAQQEAGMLICLCSKNNEEDVFEVFDCRPEMPLQTKHLVASRINWQSKSANLVALAQELQLGLGSFIFIDDNPLECAEVQANCPDVLTLPLPEDLGRLSHFLAHVWAFDHLRVTEEDKQRTALYQANTARIHFQHDALSLEAFLAGLELEVRITPMQEAQMPRVAQLTQRTNQFNSTTMRLSEAELWQLLQNGSQECLVIEVRDRFGDYGLVGVLIFTVSADAIRVDCFLLSCRVLGRGVEHEALKRLGAIGRQGGVERVLLPYRQTTKNKPALDFLEQVGGAFKVSEVEGNYVFAMPIEAIAEIVYSPASFRAPVIPDTQFVAVAQNGHEKREEKQRISSVQPKVQWWLKIANEFSMPEHVLQAVAMRKGQRPDAAEAVVAPHTRTEQLLSELWAELLHLDQVSIYDNFFLLGGHSLLATQLLSRIATIFKVKLSLLTIFEAPTVAQLAEHITEMQRTHQNLGKFSIVPFARNKELPLSFAQQRLWFLNQFMPNSASYTIPLQMRLCGVLDREALQRSLQEIVRRHETLRTTFTSIDGRAVQVIAPFLSLTLSVIDLRSSDKTTREAEALRLAVEEGQKFFDLEHGPLIRATLLRLDNEEHILLVTVQHIVFDAWSGGVLSRELMELYEAFLVGKPSPLAELPIQYVDFAAWQREWLQGEELAKQIAYWQKQLNGATPLKLPTDRSEPVVRSSQGAVESFVLPARLSEALIALSQQEGVTLFMTMLAAFQSLLHRYSGQEDIVVGTDIANRTLVETEALIGFFVNLLVLRTDLSGLPPFREVLQRVREMVLGAYAHQDVPFEKLVDALQLERKTNQVPLIRALFVFQNTPMPSFTIQGLTISPVDVEVTTTNFDLALFMWEGPQGVVGRLNYSTDLFEFTTISRMISHYQVLLESIIAQPDALVNTLEIYTEAEKEEQLKKEASRRETHRRKLKVAKRDQVDLSNIRPV